MSRRRYLRIHQGSPDETEVRPFLERPTEGGSEEQVSLRRMLRGKDRA